MECERADSLLHHYFLGSLNADLGKSLERHLDACADCGERLSAYGETVAHLARSVPQHEARERIRQALFSRIEGENRDPQAILYSQIWRFATLWTMIKTTSISRNRVGAASLLVGIFLLLGVWVNHTQAGVPPGAEIESPQQASLSGRDSRSEGRLLETRETATATAELVNAQKPSVYDSLGVTPASGISVSMLTGPVVGGTGPRGVLIASEGKAMLMALDLPPLPSYQVYQIWLVQSGGVVDAGLLSVDATGYGQTIIIPYLSLAEYDGIGITIEPASGSPDPTGVSVLQGDL